MRYHMLLTLLLLFYMLSPPTASAESVSVDINQQINTQSQTEFRQEFKQSIHTSGQNAALIVTKKIDLNNTRDDVRNQACTRTIERINERLSQYEANKDKWSTRHQGVIKRLESLIVKLEARSCDTASLKTDIQTYQTLITHFAASFRAFQNTLQGSRAYVCGESRGQFKQQVDTSRQELQIVRQNAEEIQNFFKNTLKPHLSQAAKSCPQITL